MDWKTGEVGILEEDQNRWDRRAIGKDMRVAAGGALESSI